MRHLLYGLFLLSALLLTGTLVTSCQSDSGDITTPDAPTNHHTLLMYMPWSGDKNALTSYFWANINAMQKACRQGNASGSQVVVFIQTSGTEGYMFNLTDYKGSTSEALASYQYYSGLQLTTAAGISRVLRAMMAMAPADSSYAMTIGCHGLGWIPTQKSTGQRVAVPTGTEFRPHWVQTGPVAPMTRYFGGTSAAYQTDISTLAEAIDGMGVTMEFILFDDCYMSSVEVAYDLRHVTRHIIACPTEVMNDGMPYDKMGRYLLGQPDYEQAVRQFYDYYSVASYPYGTIGVVKCDELDSLAHLMRQVNARYTLADSLRSSIQRMDGFEPVLFYDLGDYVAHLVGDTTLLRAFEQQLQRAVPYKACTPYFPYYNGWGISTHPISVYSGITTSEPSTHSYASYYYQGTNWYKDTRPSR